MQVQTSEQTFSISYFWGNLDFLQKSFFNIDYRKMIFQYCPPFLKVPIYAKKLLKLIFFKSKFSDSAKCRNVFSLEKQFHLFALEQALPFPGKAFVQTQNKLMMPPLKPSFDYCFLLQVKVSVMHELQYVKELRPTIVL